jgi:hypothetical protein
MLAHCIGRSGDTLAPVATSIFVGTLVPNYTPPAPVVIFDLQVSTQRSPTCINSAVSQAEEASLALSISVALSVHYAVSA